MADQATTKKILDDGVRPSSGLVGADRRQKKGSSGLLAALLLLILVGSASGAWLVIQTIGHRNAVGGSGRSDLSAQKKSDWSYAAAAGQGASVSLLPANAPETPTVEYRFGTASLKSTLLRGPEGPARVIESELDKGTLSLRGTLPGTTVEYRTVEGGLKEDIVLLRREAADAYPEGPAYAFALVLDGAVPAKGKDGQILPSFNDAATGKYAFHIPEPYMKDANGAESREIEVRMRQTQPTDSWYENAKVPGSQWLLVMRPSSVWLLDSKRSYPVRIDPTIIH